MPIKCWFCGSNRLKQIGLPSEFISCKCLDCGNITDDRDVFRAKEICICAAVRAEDGTIIRGQTHRDCRDGIIRRGGKITVNLEDEGFITSTGRFVNRKEGFELMKAVGWESKNPQGYQLCGLLFSEDLF